MSSLLAYDADGIVIGTLEHLVIWDADGNAARLADFADHEAKGGQHTDFCTVAGAKGSKVWPEYIGAAALQFQVELAGPPGGKYIAALVHKDSGHRRERHVVEHAIASTPIVDGVRDIRHIVGSPQRPLHIDEHGRTVQRAAGGGTPAQVPIIGR